MHTTPSRSETNSNQCHVLILHDLSAQYIAQLQQRFPQVRFSECKDPDDVDEAIAQARAPVIFSFRSEGMPGPAQRKALFAPDVRWIQVAGTGFDHMQPVTRDDVILTNCAGVLSDFMAEAVLGSMLSLNFGLHRYIEQQQQHQWREIPWTGLQGKTALVIGLGTIGRRVARNARHLGMRVLGLRSRQGSVDEVDELIAAEQMRETLARVDVLCVHVPLTENTRNLIDEQAFAHMRRGIIVINTSRGGVMDEQALARALNDGTVAAAHLDVFETEPLPENSELWDTPNLVITPHMTDTVADFEVRFVQFFADNLQRWLDDEPLHNIVDPQRGY
jgi:D-2-hydroxyacid dehydrogenase (NADP+)